MTRVVVLSPHLDDAAYSCGGFLAACRREGRAALVLTLFAGRPPEGEELAGVALLLHFAMGGPDDPVGVRRREDEEALSLLGARALHLDRPEAAYRRASHPIFQRSGRLPADRAASEIAIPEGLAADVASRFPSPDDVTIYAPLGVGGHVDHLLAHEAGGLLRARGYDVLWYEDFPYATDAAAMEVARAKMGDDLEPVDVPLDDDDVATRAAAMACYRSQARMLFRALDHDKELAPQLRALVAAYASSAGGPPRERYWRVPVPARGSR